MKTVNKGLILGVLLGLWSGVAAAQTIRIANNNANAPTGDNVFSTLQAALDMAEVGDIIHVIGSPSSYGNVTVRKLLHIFGIGYNPDKDLPEHSLVGAITLTTGTGTDASGTHIEGLVLSGNTHITQAISDITIRKCFFSNVMIKEDNVGKSNIVITDNIFIPLNVNLSIDLNWTGNDNIIVRNNVFVYSAVQLHNALVANNVFTTGAQAIGVFNSSNTIFANNIFFRMQPVDTGSVAHCIYNNNLAIGSMDDTLPTVDAPMGTNTGQGNINNAILSPTVIDPVNFFVNYPELGDTNWDDSYDLELHLSNPGIGAGIDGSDLGIFGGEDPFNNVVNLPIIQILNTAASIKEGNDLPTTVGVQAN
jgi:acetyltransferase-like isoleucine patch superfamily enzyme